MELIIGGAFQGKGQFAKETYQIEESKIVEAEHATIEQLRNASMIMHFHLWIKERMKSDLADSQIYELVEELIEENPNVVITMDEMGCGIVPAEAFDRQYRELVGRVSCEIAKKAKHVYRVNCGIGMQIK